MTKIFILAHVEDALAHSLLRELDDISRSYERGILFEVGTDAPHLSVEEMARIMAISPDIKAIDLWRRQVAMSDD